MATKSRGSAGRFISSEDAKNLISDDLPELVHRSTKMSGALKDLQEEKENSEFDKPLVSVSVNNPISWFQKLLNQLKKKQTTTLTFRLGVPLIALPVLITAFAGIFFGLGKITNKSDSLIEPTPTEIVEFNVTKTGVLKKIMTDSSNAYYLFLNNGEVIKIIAPEEVKLSSLYGKRILASGVMNMIENTLTIHEIADLEELPSSPIPIPTILITDNPTTTPFESTDSGDINN